MRARMIILVLVILAVAGFAAQNWPEINRTSTLNFGVVQADAPMGLILLTLLGLTLLVFLATAATMRSRNLVESRQYAKDIHVQRELAEKAEVSRFTDLRQMLDSHLRDEKQRESVAHSELERSMAQHQRELRNQLEQMYHLLTSRLSELERRLDSRPGRVERVEEVQPTRVVEPAPAMHSPQQGRERV
ncbi:hypothetical protein EZ313_20970 [Ramlibacter henchirensis]|uniref:LapA family protein n=1 Tax=Ramlibacter henchirensis TaxID=204072 RepID=A0A4Z0BNK8_9BURK|nr:hypothetical protein [Ramlibacter henchirensis]TFZ00907.1 hypothetical protein EZ313_20970 [Ramlibacter henchirensis]